MSLLVGTSIVDRVAIGPVVVHEPYQADATVRTHDGSAAQVQAQLAAFECARDAARAQLVELKAQLDAPGDASGIVVEGGGDFAFAQLQMLEDEEVALLVEEAVRDDSLQAASAVSKAFDQLAELFAASGNETIAQRVPDLKDVRNRLLRCLDGAASRDLSVLPGPCIVVARELLPSDTLALDRENVLGIATECGGTASHVAIIARSLGVATVVGVRGLVAAARDASTLVVDGTHGVVAVDPSPHELQRFQLRRSQADTDRHVARAYAAYRPITLDGTVVAVKANVSDAPASCSSGQVPGAARNVDFNYATAEALGVAASDSASASSAVGLASATAGVGSLSAPAAFNGDLGHFDGVGLLRSEFLFLGRRDLPSEEEQLAVYRRMLDAHAGKPVVLRTIDFGADKQPQSLPAANEENPALGQRGIRLALAQRELFATQVRAALRASAYGPLKIMFPMVTSIEEFRSARDFVLQQGAALDSCGVAWNRDVAIGAMIETPAIALLPHAIAREVDFASVGTNDLVQYLCAADRMNAAVSESYQQLHPALLRVLRDLALAFEAQGKELCVCGELAGDHRVTKLLVGLGIRSLSMDASAMPRVKQAICTTTLEDARRLADAALMADTQQEVIDLLQA